MKFLALIILFVTVNIKAQFISANLKVDGLTCSMCSKSVHKALASLNFIDSIIPDLETTRFKVYFKKESKVELFDIRDKVEGAGFSVGEIKVSFNFDNADASQAPWYKYQDYNYQLVGVSEKTLKGLIEFKVLDKGFVSKKEFKTNSKNSKYKCVYSSNSVECKCPSSSTHSAIHITL